MSVLIPTEYVPQVRAITDRGHIVIDGDQAWHDAWNEWVLPSPWCDLPDTCQTCDTGEGWVIRAWGHDACPDCVLCPDGKRRPVHRLQATCGPCAGFGETDGEECWDCDDGLVDLGRFTVQIVPVPSEAEMLAWLDRPNDPEPDHIALSDTCSGIVTAFLVTNDGDSEPLTLDPLPQTGQFVAEFVRQP